MNITVVTLVGEQKSLWKGAEMNHKEPGFELEDSKMGQNGLLAFVRLDFELRGFQAWILFLVSALGTPWDLLNQRFAAIDGYRRRCVGSNMVHSFDLRLKKYEELSATEKIQADCDLKETNIILQGLPSDVYSLVNTKFLNSLPPEWSKFVTDVNLMTSSHFNTYQSSYNNLQFQQQLSPSLSSLYGSIHPTQHYSTTYSSIPLAITYPSVPYPNAYSSTVHQDACPQPQSIPQIKYTVSIVNQQIHLVEFPQIDSGLAVLVFKQ
ncbi:hypothetical protein Tco_0634788 [Tanacetum coccineum]